MFLIGIEVEILGPEEIVRASIWTRELEVA